MKNLLLTSLIFGILILSATALATEGLERLSGDHDRDLRFFTRDSARHPVEVIQGAPALGRMAAGADLNLWLAGNQFFAMEDVIRAFMKSEPSIRSVGVVTLPPGLIADAILKGGWRYQGKSFRFRPDLYATVDLRHLRKLSSAGLASKYITYIHNELSLMVARANPKNVRGIDDLQRRDLRIELPNPLSEGIMSTYGKKVLLRHHLWERLSAGKECQACSPVRNVHFTEVHHREIPASIETRKADVGLVWKTEIENALRDGKAVSGVDLPPEDSLRSEVSYMLTPIWKAPHRRNAEAYLRFVLGHQGQAAYEAHGFRGVGEGGEAKPIQ